MKTKSRNIKKLDLSIEWDATKLRNLMTNAKRLGRDDIYFDAVRQIARIEGQNIDDPLEADFAIVMRALEEALTAESGQTKRLSRTKQKLKRAGLAIYQFVGKVVDVRPRSVSQGFGFWRPLETHDGRHHGNCGWLRCGPQAPPAETA